MGMISPWLTVIAVLAAARITRIITTDTITAGIRMRLVNALGIESKAAELLQCNWCAGMWAAAGTVTAAWVWGDHWWAVWPLSVLAAAYMVGWIMSGDGE